ncbi:MAG: response regulator [Treponema sp.]|nr:response regulator [Treponema sp.]
MSGKRIVLAIDDNMMQLDMFGKMLGDKYDVRTANSASHALNYLNSDKADIILLDIEMPNISGFDFLLDIRKIPSYMDVPIIIVSGTVGPGFTDQAKAASAYTVLHKPVKTDDLIATIEEALAVKA